MVIVHNSSALNTLGKLKQNTADAQASLEKLSSGLRINKAADDAAGLAISQKMQAQINGLTKAGDNAQNGISLIQTAEGGLSGIQSMLQRMNELAVQAANGTNSTSDRTAIQAEVDQLVAQIHDTATTTAFNNITLLNGNLDPDEGWGEFSVEQTVGSGLDSSTLLEGSMATNTTAIVSLTGVVPSTVYGTDATVSSATINGAAATVTINGNRVTLSGGGVTGLQFDVSNASNNDTVTVHSIVDVPGKALNLQIGADTGQEMSIAISGYFPVELGVYGLDVTSSAGAGAAITAIQNAIDNVSSQRATLGAYQNRLTHVINNLTTENENTTDAESRITDVDMASAMTQYTKNNILVQSGEAMLAQANQLPQGVLKLLSA